MRHGSDVRVFYSQSEDAAMAFAYRLRKASHSQVDDTPNYSGLAQALKHVCIATAMKMLAQHRDALLDVVLQYSDQAGHSRLSFLSELMWLARMSGDVELAAMVAHSYVDELTNSPLVEPTSCARGIEVLDPYTEDPRIQRSVRAQVALQIAQILFRTGQSPEALKRVRQTLRLTRKPEICGQCLLLMGEIDMGRGAPSHARRRFERAMKSVGGIDASMQTGTVAAIKWIVGMMRLGNTGYLTREAYEPILSSLVKSRSRLVLLATLQLEIDRWQGSTKALPSAIELYGAMKKLSLRWRRCSSLALALAYCLTENDRYSSAHQYIDYVVRMTTRFHDSAHAIEALLLSAKAYWAEGQFHETLSTIRRIRARLRNQRPTVTLGCTLLLRAKVAFYRNALKHAVRLSMRANDLFAKHASFRESFEAVRVVASCSIWFGVPEGAIGVLSPCVTTQQKLNKEPNAIIPTYLVLQSLSYASQRPDEASSWCAASRAILGDAPPSKARLLDTLMQTEANCQQGDCHNAAVTMESAIKHLENTDHRIIRSLCYYQLIRMLVLDGKHQKARKYLVRARSVCPLCEHMMWKHVSAAIEKQDTELPDFKPIGAFPF